MQRKVARRRFAQAARLSSVVVAGVVVALALYGGVCIEERDALRSATGGDYAHLRVLLALRPSFEAAKDSNDSTCLHLAARWGHTKIVELLLDRGADPNGRETSGATPLHCAAQGGRPDVVQLLLDHGARVDAPSEFYTSQKGFTPLHWAAWHGHAKAAEVLLANGSEVDAQTDQKWTPLHWAAQRCKTQVVELLRNSGAQYDIFAASSSCDLERAKTLVNQQPALSCAQLGDGWTPLHFAAYHDCLDVIEYLLSCGADPNVADGRGKTAYDRASDCGDFPSPYDGDAPRVADLLRKHGALTAQERKAARPGAQK